MLALERQREHARRLAADAQRQRRERVQAPALLRAEQRPILATLVVGRSLDEDRLARRPSRGVRAACRSPASTIHSAVQSGGALVSGRAQRACRRHASRSSIDSAPTASVAEPGGRARDVLRVCAPTTARRQLVQLADPPRRRELRFVQTRVLERGSDGGATCPRELLVACVERTRPREPGQRSDRASADDHRHAQHRARPQRARRIVTIRIRREPVVVAIRELSSSSGCCDSITAATPVVVGVVNARNRSGELRIGRIGMRDQRALQRAVGLEQVDEAPVRERRDGEPADALEHAAASSELARSLLASASTRCAAPSRARAIACAAWPANSSSISRSLGSNARGSANRGRARRARARPRRAA